jgi:mannose-6-phosphate isomerase-like protein (cupin superfamily)
MAETFDLAATFVHLDHAGGAEPVPDGRSVCRGSAAAQYARLVGVFDVGSSKDLHSSMQEVHPAADEVLFLVSGALDLIVEEVGKERAIPLEAGQAAIVPRGVWHRLVMRRPGRLLFINSRAGMESRSRRREVENE